MPVPDDRGFALVGDSDRCDVSSTILRCLRDDFAGAVPYLHRIVLDPAGLRKDLAMLHLRGRAGVAFVENDASRARGSLVDRGDQLGHGTRIVITRGVTIDRMNVESEHSRGLALAQQGQIAEAEAIFRAIVAQNPQHWRAHQNLGVALQVLERQDEAVSEFEIAMKLQPNDTAIPLALVPSLLQLQRPADAIEVCRAALRIKPDDAEIHGVFAEALLMSGDFRRGWAEYEWRWKCDTFKDPRRNFARPQWRGAGGRIADQTILIHCEQGFGDVIQIIRYAPLLAQRGADVTVEAPLELVHLIRTMPSVAMTIAKGNSLPPFDLHIPLMSLPLAFGTTLSTVPANVPYLSPAAKAVEAWRARLGEKTSRLRVGLAWAARQDSARGLRKSIPPAMLERLVAVNDGASSPLVSFVSLQKSDTTAGVTGGVLPMIDLSSKLMDFSDSAALIANLDLVISVDTAIAHLAGAMGKPVWTMLAFGADFRWLLDRADSPWYPTMRLFRQPSPGDWKSVLDEVSHQLRAMAQVQ